MILRAPYLENCRVIWISAYLLSCLFLLCFAKVPHEDTRNSYLLTKIVFTEIKNIPTGKSTRCVEIYVTLQFFEANGPLGHVFEKKTFFRCVHRMCLYQISGLYWFRWIRGSGKNKYTFRYTSKFLLGIPYHLQASRGFDRFSVAFSNFITIIIAGNFQNSAS